MLGVGLPQLPHLGLSERFVFVVYDLSVPPIGGIHFDTHYFQGKMLCV